MKAIGGGNVLFAVSTPAIYSADIGNEKHSKSVESRTTPAADGAGHVLCWKVVVIGMRAGHPLMHPDDFSAGSCREKAAWVAQ